MKLTIDDLLNSLRAPDPITPGDKSLSNTKETWERIGNKDNFAELALDPSELQSFLEEWISDNEYMNI